MNDQQDDVYADSLKQLHDLKARFDNLTMELKKVHEEWKKTEKRPPQEEDMGRLRELVDLEMKISEEINEVIESSYQLMHKYLEQSR